MTKKIKLKAGKGPADSLSTQARSFKASASRGRELHPYIGARLIEDPKSMRHLDARTRQKLRERWTPSKIDALATDVILERLRALAVSVSEPELRRLSLGHRSAWDASRDVAGGLSGNDTDFVALAFCTLWKRWLPDRPSVEMIEDWISEGYRCSDTHRHDEGLDAWRSAWDGLQSLLKEVDATTAAKAQRATFDGFSSVLNWTQDYVEEYVHIAPHRADEGLLLVDAVLAQFANESALYRQDLLAAKADILALSDRFEEAERAAQIVIDTWPRCAIGYATLASVAEHAKRNVDAIAALERALSVPVDDADDFDIAERLAGLREHPDAQATSR